MRLAIVVDWITDSGGAEYLLSETLKTFPGTEVFSVVDTMSDAEHARLGIPRARTTWLQHVRAARRNHRPWLPLMPSALRRLDLRGFDTVLAISHAVAKAPPVRAGQKLLCLTLSPMRYAWDLRDEYLAESGLGRGLRGVAARAVLDRLRAWDLRTSARVDAYASISAHIAERVRRCYGRESVVIYPPVDTAFLAAGNSAAVGARPAISAPEPGARPYVTASRFVPYKRVDLIVRAFAGLPARQLVVIGDGPDRAKVHAAAAGASNVRFAGHASREEMRAHLCGARAFVFAANEDFGIAPVEAQACGVPVIAYGCGGALETIIDGRTGLFFDAQSEEAIRDAVARFEASEGVYRPDVCRANAERFAAARFRHELAAWVAQGR